MRARDFLEIVIENRSNKPVYGAKIDVEFPDIPKICSSTVVVHQCQAIAVGETAIRIEEKNLSRSSLQSR